MIAIFIFVATIAVRVDGQRYAGLVVLPLLIGESPFRALWLSVRATVTTVTFRHRPTAEPKHPAPPTDVAVLNPFAHH